MHTEAYVYVARVLTRYPITPGSRILEIGARDINGSVRELFLTDPPSHYLGTDIAPGPGVDLVGDGATLQVDHPQDVVVCCEVLEHTPLADAIIAHAGTLLRVGGRIILTAAGCRVLPDGTIQGRTPHSAVHGGALYHGEFYRNITMQNLHTWLQVAGFTHIDTEYDGGVGDVRATAIKG